MPLRRDSACGLTFLLAALALGAPGSLLAAAPTAGCPAPTPIVLGNNPQWIDRGVEVLFDPQRSYRLQEVMSAPLCRQFRPVPGVPAFGVEPRGVWLQWRLPGPIARPDTWRLLMAYGANDRVCVHWPRRSGGYRSDCSDIDQPLGQGVRSPHGWYFHVPVDLDPARPVLLYTQGNRVVVARLAVGTVDAMTDTLVQRQSLRGMLWGATLILAMAGLVMFAVQRERIYALYSSYTLVSILFFGLEGGQFGTVGFADRASVVLQWPLGGLLALLQVLFFQSFLETRIHAPRLHRLLWATLIPLIFATTFLPLLSPSQAERLGLPFGFALMITLITTMVLRLRQGSRAAAYSLLVFTVQGGGAWLQAAEMRGHAWISVVTNDVLIAAGHLLFSGLLAVGLVDRIRRLTRERDQAKDLALSSQKLALHHAHYDPVTRLPNRVRFREDLEERLLQLVPGERYALVTLGLDRFGLLNDALGHTIGDSVLGEIARRLQSRLGADTLLARIGADLFAWLDRVPVNPTDLETLRQRCESLQEAVSDPLRLGSGARCSASIGIALCPDHATSAERLLQYSDVALHRAKLGGSGNLQLFDPAMHQSASQHLELTKALHGALERGELVLHYQPIVSFRTGELLGVESLARWRREDGQYVQPDQFVPLIQSGPLLRPFTEWGLRCFYAQISDWHRRGIAIPYASFNLTAQQLHLPDIEKLVLDLLDRTGAPAERVTLEVTEGTLLDNMEATAQLLGRLRKRGIAVAVDDFGVGYASPHYLRTLPVDILKLDGVFLHGVPQQEEANSVLEGLITLGRSLHLKIVTECVETEAQARYLSAQGVSGGQGFFFSRALPAAELERWLWARPARAAA